MDAPMIDTRELAAKIRTQPNTIEGWRLQGVGPRFIKCGRLVRYRIEDVEAWIEEQTRTSTSDV